MCCRAGIAFCTVRVTRRECCVLPRMAVGCKCKCAGRGAQGCPAEQGPCTPGLCRAGTLPPARVSAQPARESPTTLRGEDVVEEQTLLGRKGASAVERVLCGQCCSQFQITRRIFCGN